MESRNTMEKKGRSIPCPLCECPAIVLSDDHPGYEEPTKFSVAECCYCDMQFCQPMAPNTALYERIYENAATLPGYSRYLWYAEQAARRNHPLEWLQSQEAMYAFIGSELKAQGAANAGRVVEVGSGLGYLTFALHKAGYDVRGLELSERAVAAARARFGDHYEVCDVMGANAEPATADTVVMTEVIEHVTDPVALLRAIRRMLRPGGTALITTPNKSATPRSSYWLTDNPPIHHWWFSETTFRRLAQMSGMTISFQRPVFRATKPSLPAYFNASGEQISPAPLVRKLLRSFPGPVLRAVAVVRNRRQRQALRMACKDWNATMCVILQSA